MQEFRYVAQRYTQGTNPTVLLSFCASASDILRWGGVPAKNERFHGGFQRALSARYRKIINFFNRGQASPGAIVLAFRKGAAQLLDLGYPKGWPAPDDLTTVPQFVQILFSSETEIDELPIEELIERVRTLLRSRSGFSPNEAADDEPEPVDLDDPLMENVAESDDEDDGDLDVGQSKLTQFYRFIGDQAAMNAWIEEEKTKVAKLKSKTKLSQREREYVAFSPEEKLRYTLVSLIRPAMIVDGQHRVNGANESEQDNVLFTVCAIVDADWVEQVFQFVILNRMAKPISKDFLTELLNSSLTNVEIEQIDKRLEIVGLKNADRRIHKYVNHDARSPFKDLIAEATEVTGVDNEGKLSQQGMLTLAKRWRSISAQGKTAEMSCFVPYLGVSTLTEARAKWSEYDTWITLFFAFWSEIKKRYEPMQVWEKKPKYHLLYIVTLQALQDLFLESKATGRVRFKSLDDFKGQVRDFFEPVPGAFFLNWHETGLQSGRGWQLIKDAVIMFQNGARLPSVQAESALFEK